jgi:hypothetical protein
VIAKILHFYFKVRHLSTCLAFPIHTLLGADNSSANEWLQVLPLCYYGAMETLELKWLGTPQVTLDSRQVRLETRKVIRPARL